MGPEIELVRQTLQSMVGVEDENLTQRRTKPVTIAP
jgi:hypothetical protein